MGDHCDAEDTVQKYGPVGYNPLGTWHMAWWTNETGLKNGVRRVGVGVSSKPVADMEDMTCWLRYLFIGGTS